MTLRILDVAPGLTQIKLPLPFELREVNVYLLRGEDGYVLIDTGYHAADCFETLEASLRHLHVAWTDIHHIVLTHMHPDHMGNAHRILDLAGGRATLSMHGVEAAHLRNVANAIDGPWFDALLSLAGSPETLREEVAAAFAAFRDHTRALDPDVTYTDGELLENRFEVIHTPGHSPGHICLYDRPAGMLLSGDHMLPGITPNIGWIQDADPLADYIASLRKVEPLEVRTVVPAHGRSFDDHRAWISETVRHHEERCGEIRAILDAQPGCSAHDVACRVWTRTLRAYHYQFAVSEILAHLVYMENRGEIRREGGTGWVTLFGGG